jgi:predicted acyl esterase
MVCLTNSVMAQSPTVVGASAGASVNSTIDPDFVVYRDVMVSMRDGVRLATDVYLPSPNGVVDPAARFPIVLIRTPYDKSVQDTPIGAASYLPKHGYAVVVQDVRGTSRSEGVFEPMVNEGWGTKEDGRDDRLARPSAVEQR